MNPRNAHLKNFRHYFSILPLFLLPYYAEVLDFLLCDTQKLLKSRLRPGSAPDPVRDRANDAPQTPSRHLGGDVTRLPNAHPCGASFK